MKRNTTAAKASFISNKSISEAFILAFFNAFSAESAGPVSIIVGSEPIDAKDRILALVFNSYLSAIFLLPIKTPAAPSTIPEELPA